jgi:DNA-binding transcriptional regulator YiaG
MSTRGPYKPAVKIPTLRESLNRLNKLPDDIKLIQEKEGLGLVQLARTFGVVKSCIFRWRRGDSTPREPLTALSIMTWADKLRSGEDGSQSS